MPNSIILELNNNKVHVTGDIKIRNRLFETMQLKHPNAFHIRQKIGFRWDGMVKYLSEAGYSKIGMLPRIISLLEEWGVKYGYVDSRDDLEARKITPKMDGIEFRDYQVDILKSIVYHKVGKLNIPFNKGVIDAATNAGKTFILLGLYIIYKRPTIILLNDSLLFNQFKEELPKLLPNTNIKFVQGKDKVFGELTVAMVQTLIRDKHKMAVHLAKFEIMLVDECDLATSKSYQWCLNTAYNTIMRIGLSGSAFTSKDKIKNEELRSWFGDILYTITKKQLVEKGISTKPIIKISSGNITVKIKGDYDREYAEAIMFNKERDKRILNRLEYNIGKNRYPILVVVRYIDHVNHLYKLIANNLWEQKVDFVHHEIKDKIERFRKFREGETDILISSLIVKRGKNLPLIKCIINATGGDSEADVIQIMGRGERTDESKKEFTLEDFFDQGHYMRRHSTHRVKYYKKQGFRVMELYKRDTIKK